MEAKVLASVRVRTYALRETRTVVVSTAALEPTKLILQQHYARGPPTKPPSVDVGVELPGISTCLVWYEISANSNLARTAKTHQNEPFFVSSHQSGCGISSWLSKGEGRDDRTMVQRRWC